MYEMKDGNGAFLKQMKNLMEEFDQCRNTFIAIGDENRQRIIMTLLGKWGGLRVGDITKEVGLSRPAISHHMKILKDAGIIGMYKVGTKNFYHMNCHGEQWHRVISLMGHLGELLEEIKAANQDHSHCVENDA